MSKTIPYPTIHERVKAQRVYGWLDDYEARALYDLAAAATGPVLEIGTYMGLSSCYLGAAAKGGVYTVDPHDPELWNPTQRKVFGDIDTAEVTRANLTACGVADRVTLVKATSEAAAADPDLPATFGLIFIDGEHKQIAADLGLWRDRVAPGGRLACHDYDVHGDEPGVRWAVRAACDEVLVAHGWECLSVAITTAIFARVEASGGAQ